MTSRGVTGRRAAEIEGGVSLEANEVRAAVDGAVDGRRDDETGAA